MKKPSNKTKNLQHRLGDLLFPFSFFSFFSFAFLKMRASVLHEGVDSSISDWGRSQGAEGRLLLGSLRSLEDYDTRARRRAQKTPLSLGESEIAFIEFWENNGHGHLSANPRIDHSPKGMHKPVPLQMHLIGHLCRSGLCARQWGSEMSEPLSRREARTDGWGGTHERAFWDTRHFVYQTSKRQWFPFCPLKC